MTAVDGSALDVSSWPIASITPWQWIEQWIEQWIKQLAGLLKSG